MRALKSGNGLTVKAIAGTYVVILAMDVTDAALEGLLGFAVKRTDKTEKEEYWLKGLRTFEETTPGDLRAGTLVSTQEEPIQDFCWGDFTAKPEHDYVYSVVPVYGRPKALKYGKVVDVEITTESETDSDTHDVYFNRGVIGSQAYAREFKNTPPNKLSGDEQKQAYAWLSRGLEEAMLEYIARGERKGYGLRAAVYEFSYEPAIKAFGNAAKKGKDVQIVYDARRPPGDSSAAKTARKRVDAVDRMLKKYGLTDVATGRTEDPTHIAHNKFIVLLKDGKPVSVWTGSTNFTESGIFGQSNVGHVVNDADVAQRYLDYWTELQKDPTIAELRKQTVSLSPDLPETLVTNGISTVFSPRSGLSSLNWYATAMKDAERIINFTAAFGVNDVFLEVFEVRAPGHLKYIFLEKWGVNKAKSAETQKALGADVFNQVAVGYVLGDDVLEGYLKERWLAELQNPLSKNVRYTHTKYMLVDPLGEEPVVVTGSANFSDASTTYNDENMLVIRGDTRVADIYLGEFMRLWQHYRYREIVNENGDSDGKPNYLTPDSSWTERYFKPGTVQFAKRQMFVAT